MRNAPELYDRSDTIITVQERVSKRWVVYSSGALFIEAGLELDGTRPYADYLDHQFQGATW